MEPPRVRGGEKDPLSSSFHHPWIPSTLLTSHISPATAGNPYGYSPMDIPLWILGKSGTSTLGCSPKPIPTSLTCPLFADTRGSKVGLHDLEAFSNL